jgi:hypothetical protein
MTAPPPASESPPSILEIFRDRPTPGREGEFRAVEEDAARACVDLQCPHPHLALESLTGATEVWWLNAFASEDEKRRVVDAYAANAPLTAALAAISTRRKGLTTWADGFASYRPDLSRGAGWQPAGARFAVVTETRGDVRGEGSVFEGDDGTRFVLRPARSRDEADALAAAAGGAPETRVFAVRPYWGYPAAAWVAADPEFWAVNPAAQGSRPVG